MENGNKLGMTLSFFIIVLIGLVLLRTTADEVSKVTEYSSYEVNETITFTGTSNQSTVAEDDLIAGLTFQNDSGYEHTAGDDWNLSLTTGVVTIAGNLTADGTGTFYLDYTYTPDDYVVDGTARTLVGLVTIFFALAILGIGAGYAINLLKDFI